MGLFAICRAGDREQQPLEKLLAVASYSARVSPNSLGTLLGGQGDAVGDMNRLVYELGWSESQIVQTYKSLGNWCVLLILGLYILFLLRMNNQIWLSLQARFIL
jgi:hypothetical protein